MTDPRAAEKSAELESAPAASPAAVSAPARTAYVCPMPEHVSITYDHPGKCPICGMTLVPTQTANPHAQGDH
jgi:rubrerythrin